MSPFTRAHRSLRSDSGKKKVFGRRPHENDEPRSSSDRFERGRTRSPRSGEHAFTEGAPRRAQSLGGADRHDRPDRPSRFSSPRSGGFRGGRGGGGGGGSRSGNTRRKFTGDTIDYTRFIKKAVVTEKVEHYVPEHKFVDFHIDEKIKKNIISRGYEVPTPIQDRSIPQILAGNDVVGIANTGTGKTGAFLIPLVHKVMNNKMSKVLIVVPTRELAQQIESELKLITKMLPVYSAVCVGGTYIGVQIKTLRQKNEFIIGTPGRLVDLIDRAKIVLKEFDTIVLDEADRMLDMGFIADMKMIMAGMPADHQTLLFSATMSKEVEKIVREFLVEPTQISVKTEETAKNIDQDVVHVRRGENKIEILADLLKSPEFDKVLVFTRTKSGAQRLSEALYHMKFTAEAIHGDKTQYMRQKALRMFKEGKVQILVATDVAARGLDISNVSHVINFDVPATYDDYVHRIGRTGRGGKTGKALTFVE